MDELMTRLNSSLQLTRELEALMRQDSDELDECTRGQILTAYRDAMEQAISLLRQIRRQLQIYRDEQKQMM